MIFDIKPKRDYKIEKMYKKALKDLSNFFGFKWTQNTPNIFIVYDRKTIDALRYQKTKDWNVAWADQRGIYFLDGASYKKHSSHNYSDSRFEGSLRHELAHSFTFILSKGVKGPIWLLEGIAEVASGKKISFVNKFSTFLKYYSSWESEGYQESYCGVKILIQKYGKEKLLKLIKSLPKTKNQKDFNTLFKKIYAFFPTYKNFNKLLK